MAEPAARRYRRYASFAGSVMSAVGAGTNYAYSAYAPQLGQRLHLSSTDLNIIGAAGNLGVYLSGPLWGLIVDQRGPRVPLGAAGLLLLVGYFGIRMAFDGVLVLRGGWELGMLALFGFCTGSGGNAALTSAVNATAKSFHDKTRATATAIVLSGFGLSAFVFSTLAATLFPGQTSAFLLTAALGTSSAMLVGFFTIRAVPPLLPGASPGAGAGAGDEEDLRAPSDMGDSDGESIEPLDDLSEVDDYSYSSDLAPGADEPTAESQLLPAPAAGGGGIIPRGGGRGSFELSPPRAASPNLGEAHRRIRAGVVGGRRPAGGNGRRVSRQRRRREREEITKGAVDVPLVDVHGTELLTNLDFWMLFVILSCLSGTGLMWINNVGSVAQALWSYNHPEDPNGFAKLQAAQVSIVSIFNCLGRILIGITSDVSQHHFGAKRSYLLAFVSLAFIVSQLVAARISRATALWIASSLLGLSYGAVFGIMPMVSLEWFGMGHFSQNWGFLSLSPLLGGNLFNLFFGRNYDAHSRPVAVGASTSASAAVDALAALIKRAPGAPDPGRGKQCFDGRLCYVDSLTLTTVACCVALVLSVWAAWRDRRRSARRDGWQAIGEEPRK